MPHRRQTIGALYTALLLLALSACSSGPRDTNNTSNRPTVDMSTMSDASSTPDASTVDMGTGDLGDMPDMPALSGPARMQFLHAERSLPAVDMYVDGARVFRGLRFGQATTLFPAPPNRELMVRAEHQPNSSEEPLIASLSLGSLPHQGAVTIVLGRQPGAQDGEPAFKLFALPYAPPTPANREEEAQQSPLELGFLHMSRGLGGRLGLRFHQGEAVSDGLGIDYGQSYSPAGSNAPIFERFPAQELPFPDVVLGEILREEAPFLRFQLEAVSNLSERRHLLVLLDEGSPRLRRYALRDSERPELVEGALIGEPSRLLVVQALPQIDDAIPRLGESLLVGQPLGFLAVMPWQLVPSGAQTSLEMVRAADLGNPLFEASSGVFGAGQSLQMIALGARTVPERSPRWLTLPASRTALDRGQVELRVVHGVLDAGALSAPALSLVSLAFGSASAATIVELLDAPQVLELAFAGKNIDLGLDLGLYGGERLTLVLAGYLDGGAGPALRAILIRESGEVVEIER